MLEVFEKLKELQKVLPKKYDLQVRIEDAPKKLSSQEELLARLKKEYIEKNAIYEEVRKKIAHLKGMVSKIDEDKSGKINLSMWTSQKTEGTFVESEIN